MSPWLSTLALLACPVGMGLMMVFMVRGGRDKRPDPRQQELARLQAEIDHLRTRLPDSQERLP
jgi:hypothetical protein